jgi:peptide/nickel transport system substrate-binding protein
MSSTGKRWRLVVLLAVLGLVIAACGGDDASDTTEADGTGTTEASDTTEAGEGTATTTGDGGGDYCADAAPGNLIWAHEQEPSSWQFNDPAHQLSITSWLVQAMWEGPYGVAANITFFPELGEGEVNVNDDGSVTIAYTLRDGLMWSDGEPFTPEDIQFWQELIMETDGEDEEGNPIYVFPFADRTGESLVTDFRIISDTEFEIDMSAFFAGWQEMYEIVPPAHAFEGMTGAEINEAIGNWQDADGNLLPSTGPMVLTEWNPGVSVVMERNENYHGSVSPDVVNQGGIACVDGMTMTVVPDTDAQVNAMRSGEAHIIHTQPQLEFEELNEDPRFVSAVNPGPIYEHWGLNLYNVHLSDPLVREAVAYAFDKGQVVETLYARIFGDALDPAGLWNTFFMPNQQPFYEQHGTEYEGNNIDAARGKLEEAGYTEGADGIYEHPENGRLSLRVGTTGGNALRELQQQVIQAQFAAAGIEIVIDNVPGSAYFNEVPFSEPSLDCALSGGTEGDCSVWDITQFAWVGGPWPGGQVGAYRSDGFGPYGLQSEEYDTLADECDTTTDETERNACYNELDKFATTLEMGDDGLFMLPITQKPDTYFYDSEALSAAGVSPDMDAGGPIVNIVDFKLAG